MKRFLVTILSMLYMLSATGATVHIHYCMGKLVAAGFIDKDEDECGKCGMSKSQQKKGCCKDEHKTIKSADHHAAKISFAIPAAGKALPVPAPILTFHRPYSFRSAGIIALPVAQPPPCRLPSCPIYIQVCNFRI